MYLKSLSLGVYVCVIKYLHKYMYIKLKTKRGLYYGKVLERVIMHLLFFFDILTWIVAIYLNCLGSNDDLYFIYGKAFTCISSFSL